MDACLGRFHDLPPADADPPRRPTRSWPAGEGAAALHERLRGLDPETAARLAPRDLQRIVRALEVAESTGVPLSRRFREPAGSLCRPGDPAHLPHASPAARSMRGSRQGASRWSRPGFPEEVRRLLESGVPPHAPGMKSVGYAEWLAFAAGQLGGEEAMALFVRNSRRYAKRQETWFRNRHPARIEISIPADEPPDRDRPTGACCCLREGELPLDRRRGAT